MKAYLSAPDVFMRNESKIGKEKKEICRFYGIEAQFPSDNLDLDYVFSQKPLHASQLMYKGNIELIKNSDIVFANISPFRGWSMDCGVAHEIGYFDALEKPIFIYANTNLSMADRVGMDENGYCNKGYVVEDFKDVENLMIMRAATLPLFYSDNSNKDDLSAMDSFKLAVKQVSKMYNLK